MGKLGSNLDAQVIMCMDILITIIESDGSKLLLVIDVVEIVLIFSIFLSEQRLL